MKGVDLYGEHPKLALAGPDDAATEERWIPTTSVDQHAATLAGWLGVSPSNLGRFSPAGLCFPP